jgi:hypothetical protein
MSRLEVRGHSRRSATLAFADLALVLAWGFAGLLLEAAFLMQAGSIVPSW